MNRYLILLLILAACQPAPPKAETQALQNILFIVGDDHSTNVLGCYGNEIVRTPNLDRLAGQGVRFANAFANAPMCSASRQSFLTGRYPHATGVTLLRTAFPDENRTLAEHLKPLGYQTAAIGKMHFNNGLSHGFDTLVERKTHRQWLETHPPREVPDSIAVRPKWKPFRDHSRTWLNAEARPGSYYDADDNGTFYANSAIRFLETHQADPFCMWLSFHEPHSPFNFPIEFHGKYNPADMPLPSGSPEDDQWIPAEFKDLTEAERRGIISAYYTSVEYMDKNVGLVLDKLEALGLAENTLVVYIGDHGYLLNDHKRFEKHMMWEPATRAPLIIRAGKQFEAGKVIESLAEFVDIAPTLLDILGHGPLADAQGKSLKPLLAGETNQHKDRIFSEFLADNKAMVRTAEWKYIFTTGQRDLGQGYATGNPPPGITHRLYDLRKDADETSNVFDQPENAAIVANLQASMLNWFRETHPNADGISAELSLEQQLVAFCEPPDAGADVGAK